MRFNAGGREAAGLSGEAVASHGARWFGEEEGQRVVLVSGGEGL